MTVASTSTAMGDDIATHLKTAMRRMPAAVALITTVDPETLEPAGLAASAVIPVSMDPPSMLVAINRSTSAHPVIARARRFCINLLDTAQGDLVPAFSNSRLRESRFQGDHWAQDHGLPYLPASCTSIFCQLDNSTVHGTHELFIGNVFDVKAGSGTDPMGWLNGAFARLGAY